MREQMKEWFPNEEIFFLEDTAMYYRYINGTWMYWNYTSKDDWIESVSVNDNPELIDEMIPI